MLYTSKDLKYCVSCGLSSSFTRKMERLAWDLNNGGFVTFRTPAHSQLKLICRREDLALAYRTIAGGFCRALATRRIASPNQCEESPQGTFQKCNVKPTVFYNRGPESVVAAELAMIGKQTAARRRKVDEDRRNPQENGQKVEKMGIHKLHCSQQTEPSKKVSFSMQADLPIERPGLLHSPKQPVYHCKSSQERDDSDSSPQRCRKSPYRDYRVSGRFDPSPTTKPLEKPRGPRPFKEKLRSSAQVKRSRSPTQEKRRRSRSPRQSKQEHRRSRSPRPSKQERRRSRSPRPSKQERRRSRSPMPPKDIKSPPMRNRSNCSFNQLDQLLKDETSKRRLGYAITESFKDDKYRVDVAINGLRVSSAEDANLSLAKGFACLSALKCIDESLTKDLSLN
jgi:hypothetical protein